MAMHLVLVILNDPEMDTATVRRIVESLRSSIMNCVAAVGHCYVHGLPRGIAISTESNVYRNTSAAIAEVVSKIPTGWRGNKAEWVLVTEEQFDRIFASTP